jgi:F-type H+-transporting ATPase subunit delta
MSARVVARRYAEALADVAGERGKVDEIGAELRGFAEMVSTNRELQEVFASPIISNDDKRGVLDALIAGARPGAAVANLLRLLLKNNRLQVIRDVYDAFTKIVNERQGTVVAEVTSAGDVGESEREALKSRLEEMTGKQVELHFKTDSSLIGGLVTRVGSVVYDGSIRTQLEGIKQKMMGE